MFPILMIALALTMGDDAPAADARIWQLDEFMISLWGGPGSPELARCLAQDANFNTVMAGLAFTPPGDTDLLDLCHEHGMRVLLAIEPQDIGETIKTHPALWGYFCFDEPVQQSVEYSDLAPKANALRAADPTRPVYINLNNADDPVAFIQTVSPDLLSIDRYQWWYGREDYIPLLERYRRLSLTHDLPLLWWVEANADEDRTNTPADNQQKLRQSVFTALAYGVKGIQWFGWGEACSWEPKGQGRWGLKPAGEHVGAINAELLVLGPVLIGLESVDVFHTAPLPAGGRLPPDDLWVQPAGGQLVMGLFRDVMRRDYVLIANRDHTSSCTATLELPRDVKRVRHIQKTSARWTRPRVTRQGDRCRVRIRLDAGDGELLLIQR